ncbi:MAG: excisionase, partial [Methylobacter sp.]
GQDRHAQFFKALHQLLRESQRPARTDFNGPGTMSIANPMITLQQWNETLFSGRYTLNTLRTWARNGHICPAPQKIGKDWMVTADARYRKPKKPAEIPANVDMSIMPTDPVVLHILNQRAMG